MGFIRIKPFGWALNEKLTSAQITQLDADHAKAVDKTGDTITGVITIAAAAALVVASGGAITCASGSALNVSGAASVKSGGILTVESGGSVIVASGGSIAIDGAAFLSSVLSVSGVGAAISVSGSGAVSIGSGGTIGVGSGGTINAVSGSTTLLAGTISMSATATLTAAAGGTWTINSAVAASNITISGFERLKVASRSVSRTISGSGISTINTGTALPHFNRLGAGQYSQVEIANQPSIHFNLDVPHNAVLTSLFFRLKPATGHGVPAPAFLPILTLYKRDLVTSAPVTIGTVSDSYINAATYELAHNLTVTGLSETVDRVNYVYYATFNGEWGANSIAGLALYGGSATMTITEYDEGNA